MSVGVAIYPSDGCDVETLLAKADKQMYQSKRKSKSEAGQNKAMADASSSGSESDLQKLALVGTKE
jgi:predicted signal transduction protein with EAL and GGDEF domain